MRVSGGIDEGILVLLGHLLDAHLTQWRAQYGFGKLLEREMQAPSEMDVAGGDRPDGG